MLELPSYLDGFAGEQGAGGSALEAPGLVELDETLVVLQGHSGCDAGTAGAPVHLLGVRRVEEGSHLSLISENSADSLGLG